MKVSVEVVKFLIDSGANVHAKNCHGNTPLDFAKGSKSMGGNTKIAEYLSSVMNEE